MYGVTMKNEPGSHKRWVVAADPYIVGIRWEYGLGHFMKVARFESVEEAKLYVKLRQALEERRAAKRDSAKVGGSMAGRGPTDAAR